MDMVRTKNLMSLTAAVLLALGCMAFSAFAENDLLLRPAGDVKDLGRNVYMDIARAGDRLVAVGELGVIAYSDDQGHGWVQAKVPTSVTLTAVYFPTESNGWAVGHDNIVLHSGDGGRTWVRQLDGNDVNRMLLVSAEELVGHLEQELAAAKGNEREDIEYSLENARYLLRDAQDAVQAGTSKPFMDVWFANEKEGLIVGAYGAIFRTEDGGKNWQALLDRIENSDGFHFYGLAEVDGALLLVGESGILYRSVNQGRNWETLDSPYKGSLFGIVVDPSGRRAIATGLRGNTIATTDGGINWQHKPTVSPGSLNAGVLTKDGTFVLVGLAGQMLVQEKGSADFRAVATGFPGCMSVAETVDGQLVLAGLGGLRRVALNNTNQ